MSAHGHDQSHLEETELRVRALEKLLTQKGYIDPAALDRIIETYETTIGPHNGAAVVARAWVDPAVRRASRCRPRCIWAAATTGSGSRRWRC